MANIEHDQLIWVRHDERASWKKRHFKQMRDEGVECYADGYTSARTRSVHFWSYYSVNDPALYKTIEVWFQ